jgi:uncharacterized membrane protein YeaQ/YmgE (transglycosylase-associated protein family)
MIPTTHFTGDLIMILQAFVMDPGSIIAWLVVGLIAGAVAGNVMRGSGFGIIGDIIVGLLGAMIGGFVFSFFAVGYTGFLGSTIVAFLGACIFIAIVRAVAPRRAL